MNKNNPPQAKISLCRRKSIFFIFLLVMFIIVCLGIYSDIFYNSKPKPSVLLITIDALRPDHLGCYGYKRKTSPNIDTIAKEGVTFTQAISQASVTVVSLASILTSTYPTRHGIIHQDLDIRNDFTCRSITEILKSRNYRTAIFLPDQATIAIPEWTDKGVDYRFIYPHHQGKSGYSLLTQKAMKWIKKDLKSSFFVWIHYRGVHTPYTPPPPYNRLFVNDEFYDARKKAPLVDNPVVWGGIFPKANLDNIQEVDYYIAQYDGAIKYVDYWIGELVRSLKTNGLYENTVVIISADHGEALGEHNLYFGHGNTMYDELLKVPLIIKFPKGVFANKSFKMQVRSVDIMPTVLKYLDLRIPKYTDGESLLPVIKEESGYKARLSFSKTGKMNAVRSEEWKLISYDDRPGYYELYNLKQDPGELHSLYTKGKSVFKEFKDELEKCSSGFSCGCINKKLKDGDTRQARELLHSLGYIQ